MTPPESKSSTEIDDVYKKVNRNNLSYRVDVLEKQIEKHVMSNCSEIEKLDARVDDQMLRTEKYYAVVTPGEVKDAVEQVHITEKDVAKLTSRFEDFMLDRVRRLEVANERIDHVKEDEIRRYTALKELMHKQQIRTQQWILGIVFSTAGAFIVQWLLTRT
jgi:predicted DNA-binding transcriptional regulator